MFKSLAVAVLFPFSFIAGAQAQELPRSPEQVLEAFERHFNANDVEGLMGLYGPGAAFIPAPGVQLNKPEEIQGALRQFMAAKLPIKVNIRQVYQGKDTALVVLEWTMKGDGPDGKPVDMAGTGADVVVRHSDGTWRYAVDNPFGVAAPR